MSSGIDSLPDRRGALIHLDKHDKTLLYLRKNGIWLFDHARNEWSEAKPEVTPPSGKDSEGLACYDAGRDWVYACNAVEPTVPFIYDVAGNRWIKPETQGEPRSVERRAIRTSSAALHYDSTADRLLFFQFRSRDAAGNANSAEGSGVYAYAPTTATWTTDATPFPEEFRAESRRSVNAFYDANLNVHVFHTAGDSRDNGVIWVYRHGTAAGE
ncbi:MAG: hypothetical protein WD066_12515 [Planctomycetaceae bacterium]